MSATIVIIGNVGQDPEMREHSGKPVTSVSVAVTEKWHDANGDKQERTLWYRASFWGKAAENAKAYIRKGEQVVLTATGVKANAFIDKDGKPAASVELVNSRFELLRNGGNNGGNGASRDESGDTGYSPRDMDDIPF
jgi:single-strand DNA-binding protein